MAFKPAVIILKILSIPLIKKEMPINHKNKFTEMGLEFEHLNYKDHHEFSKSELELIHSKSLVVTTEKDFSRLHTESQDQIYYLPIQLKIDRASEFERLVEGYVQHL